MAFKTILVLVISALVALGAAACGGGDDGNGETGAADTGAGEAAAEQVITIGWGAEPPSLDPGLATDTTSANVILNLMDPLVVLDQDLEPQPNFAESWEPNEDGTVYTFNLVEGTWTNGDPVTAEDFVYSWKRTLSPDLAADYAYQLFGIEGAQEYNECERNCNRLRDQVGVRAVDDRTLEVTLTSPQPWFPALVAHHSFLPVHQATVEQHGENWTEPGNIVTNGPFMLESWEHEASINLVKNPDWRNADEVTLERANGRIIVDGTTRVQSFEAGELTALDGSGLPPAEMQRLKELEEYEQYEYLGTYYYGFNVKTIPDVNQRRAMSMAIDRRTIIDNIAQADQNPAAGFTPPGIPGQEDFYAASPFAPEEGDIEGAKELMSQVENPVRRVNLFHNNAPGHREIAVAVQDMWSELGIETTIRAQEWAQYLESLGPPPGGNVHVYRLGWIYDYPEAMNGLELWTCESGNNNTNFCNEEYDNLVEEARQTEDEGDRWEIYGQLEQMLYGEDGEMIHAPIYHYTLPNLEKLCVKDTFYIGALNSMDLRDVVVEEGQDCGGQQ